MAAVGMASCRIKPGATTMASIARKIPSRDVKRLKARAKISPMDIGSIVNLMDIAHREIDSSALFVVGIVRLRSQGCKQIASFASNRTTG